MDQQPEIEELADGSVVVRGVTLAEVERRLVHRPPGRPPKPLIPQAEIEAGIAELVLRDFPIDPEFLADIVGCSRRQLSAAIRVYWGSWSETRRVSAEGRSSR